MRGPVFAFVASCLVVGFSAPTWAADDEFMTTCVATSTRKMCECMSANIPANQRAAALAGLRKSNASVEPGGMMPDPSTLSPEEMQGMQIIVAAQAACM
jgi:hypothetical protein